MILNGMVSRGVPQYFLIKYLFRRTSLQPVILNLIEQVKIYTQIFLSLFSKNQFRKYPMHGSRMVNHR